MKIKLSVILFIFSFAGLFAQVPANDNCAGAINIPLGTPPPCGVGTQQGAISTVVGDITNATPGSPYIYQNNCSGAGGPNQAVQANDVWYSFTATGYQAVMTINSTFANPNISFYSGTCAALGGGIGGCAVGVGGVVTLTVNQCVPGTTYLLQISGNAGQTGTFTMNINNSIDCTDCLVSSSLTATPPPVNGSYLPGQTVNFCLKINQYKTINTNWLHGVQLAFGSGWNAASIVPNTPTPISAAGTWSYYPAGIGVVNAVNWGPGWYFDFNPANGTPQNNFGDNICGATPNCVDVATAAQWNFCFNITTNPLCAPGSNLSVTFNTSGDGESGSWTNAGCASDASINFNAIGSCCPPNMTSTSALCNGGSSGSATATPVGVTGPYTYNWTGPLGFSSTSVNIAGSNAISNVPAGIYSLTIIDNNLCAASATVQVNQPTNLNLVPSFTNANCLGNGTGSVTANGGTGAYTYTWIPSGGNASSASLPPGNYSVQVADANNCTAITTVTIATGGTVSPAFTTPVTAQCLSGNSFVFTAADPSGTHSYSCHPILGAPLPGSTNVYGPVSFSAAGTFTVTHSISNGACASTSVMVITINPPPTVNATGTTVCVGANAPLSANGGVNYSWNGPNGFLSGVQNPVVGSTSTLSAGAYTVLVTAVTGCTNTATATVNINVPITPMALSNGPICIGSVLSLTASGAATYTWAGPNNFNSTLITPTIAATTTLTGGTYTLTAIDANGCVGSTQHIVVVNPLPPVTFTTNAKGCAPVCITFTCTPEVPIQNYNWNLGNGSATSGTSNIAYTCYTTGGVYTISVVATDLNGCSSVRTATIEAFPKPNADFIYTPNKPIVNNSSEVSFFDQTTGASIIQWNWYFMNNIDFQSGQPNPIFVYKEAGEYVVALMVKSNRGCIDTVLKRITIGEDFGIYVPNAFTPNEDGVNDIFQPKGFGITKYFLEIFDRWGEKLFTSNNFFVGWDGMYNGKMSQDDVYQWKIKITNVFGYEKEYIGHVTLIK
jgi:gliding motility-associated-like protein